MPSSVMLCTDGSDLAFEALTRGLRVVAAGDAIAIATVVETVHPMDVVGTGAAGGVMSHADATRADDERRREGQAMLAETCRRLGAEGAGMHVLHGPPGLMLCALAAEIGASVMIIGTRGQGGLRRAVLGSVSDHVVRNAPCPVLVVGSS